MSVLSKIKDNIAVNSMYESTGGNWQGRVVSIRGQTILAKLPQAAIGDLCTITNRLGIKISAQVIAFDEHYTTLSPFDTIEGIAPGALVQNSAEPLNLKLNIDPIGSVINCLGESLDKFNNKPNSGPRLSILNVPPPAALSRTRSSTQLKTGIRSIDELCSLAYGQRVGLFASAGIGKSTLLGMIAKNSSVDLVVIALVGERGREVNEFLEDALGEAGRKKSIIVVATSDEPSIRRAIAPYTATAIAEYYRAKGLKVLLLIDSLTRLARAIREVSLAAGELPVRQGYTNSVYTELPRLIERAGTDSSGSITAIYTVLTEVNADFDPLGDEIKSLLDGHIVLNQVVAAQGIRPAIDLTSSVSRLMPRLHSPIELSKREELLQIIARIKREKDLILLGGKPDRELAAALIVWDDLKRFLNQSIHEKALEIPILDDILDRYNSNLLNSI